jgi:hypothetical protein
MDRGNGSEVAVTSPRDILDALSLSGLFESHPPATALAVWDTPDETTKRKGRATLITGTTLLLASMVGTYAFYRQKRAADHLRAEALLDGVEQALHAGKADTLGSVEAELGSVFQLESRNRRAALDWTRERALVGLVKGGQDIAFEDAMNRAKETQVPEDKYAFAHVASFLFQGDTAGAAGVLPRWDEPASGDPWYQLITGAALERVGDSRARDRYASAAKLDPDLFVAQVGLVRVAALSTDAEQAMASAKALRARFPDRVEPVALLALAWGHDPARQAPAPPEVDEVQRRASELPFALHFVPPAMAALVAMDRHDSDDARSEVAKALAAAQGPAPAVWLGTLALPLGDEGLARQAALSALQFSVAYEPARALAARVAMHSGHIDEALKATEDLDASSPDVVVVRAAAAYERLDLDGLALALQALSADARALPLVSGLFAALDVLSGKLGSDGPSRGPQPSDDEPWVDLVTMDRALDMGNLVGADRIAASWGHDSESKPLRAVRLARLARYEARLDAADGLSRFALEHGTVTARVLRERVFDLVAQGRASETASLLSKYPLVIGPLATWLNAFAAASSGNADAARAKLALLDPPPRGAPFEGRTAAAVALGAVKDHKHGVDYVRDLLRTGSLDPDLVAAAVALGLRRVDHGRRRPTYE